MNFAKKFPLLLMGLAVMFLAACEGAEVGGKKDVAEKETASGQNSVATAVRHSAPVSECPNGGITVDIGIDSNGNGALDLAEVKKTEYVCNGAPGATGPAGPAGSWYSTAPAPLDECPSGGIKVETGIDTNGNGMLDPSEVQNAQYVCNGAGGAGPKGDKGEAGTNGSDGRNSLTALITEPSGTNCSAGGVKITSGLDANSNGVLDAAEVSYTGYVCNGSADQSGSDTQAPSVPTGLVATPVSASQINLTWSPSTDNVGVTGYKVYRGGTQIATSATTSYTDAGLSSGTIYTYTVAAYDAASNTSTQSVVAYATTGGAVLVAPSVVSSTPGNGQVTISWKGVPGFSEYVVYRSSAPGVATTSANRVMVYKSSAGTITYSNRWLTNGTTYYFVVTTKDSNGLESVASNEVSGMPTSVYVAPLTPTGITATAGSGKVTISFNAVAGATEYKVYRANYAGRMATHADLKFLSHSSGGSISPVISGLNSGEIYYFTVTAWNLDGESEPSVEVSATPF